MAGLRITALKIQGFRSFGRKPQTLAFPSPVAVVWAPNSHGKTSLAEAFEFLLTGRIVRRELLASSQDEFAGALRNAHIPAAAPVFVQAEAVTPSGKTHTIKRTLTADYGKREDCRTVLEIDGKAAGEQALRSLGFVLSQPPLSAPVLTQHALGYLFSARPQDRATYFKAVLELTDLETFRAAVAALDADLPAPDDPALSRLDAASAITEASFHLAPLKATVPAVGETERAARAAIGALITAAGWTVPDAMAERIAKLEEILADKRSKAFPVTGFDKQPLGSWTAPPPAAFTALTTYVTERGKVDEETRRLAALFEQALALPAVAAATEAIDCPLCATEDALTPDRAGFIRERVKDTEAYRTAQAAARKALDEMAAAVETTRKAVADALPKLLVYPSKVRRERGFRMERIRKLLGPDGEAVIDPWLAEVRQIARLHSAVQRAVSAVVAAVEEYRASLDSLSDVAVLQDWVDAFAGAVKQLSLALPGYVTAERPVADAIKAVADAVSQTTRWPELIALAKDPAGLRAALVERVIREQARQELAKALKEIDKGNEDVLDGKFQELSADVEMWWNLLRPDEMSFFAAVKPRPGTRRTIDFKAGLATKADRSDLKLRDVIAVFSQSQLHCLGLALFIARSLHEGTSFMVLDDPILASDEDYKAFFTTGVVEKLLDLGVQVIVLTQDQKTWRDLEHRYLHKNVAMFQLSLTDPGEGTVVRNTADDLMARFAKIEILVRSGHPDLLKQAGEHLRDVGERFCKEMLVRSEHAKGNMNAVISDYNGKTLEWLIPKVEPLLAKDPSHPGKLRALPAMLNPAKHDDDTPSRGALKVALGDLTYFKKEYLAG
jgi:AAA domain-containing protein